MEVLLNALLTIGSFILLYIGWKIEEVLKEMEGTE